MSSGESETFWRALEEYTAKTEEQLTVQKGDIFRALGEQNDEWIKVLLGNQIGWLPLSICEQLEDNDDSDSDEDDEPLPMGAAGVMALRARRMKRRTAPLRGRGRGTMAVPGASPMGGPAVLPSPSLPSPTPSRSNIGASLLPPPSSALQPPGGRRAPTSLASPVPVPVPVPQRVPLQPPKQVSPSPSSSLPTPAPRVAPPTTALASPTAPRRAIVPTSKLAVPPTPGPSGPTSPSGPRKSPTTRNIISLEPSIALPSEPKPESPSDHVLSSVPAHASLASGKRPISQAVPIESFAVETAQKVVLAAPSRVNRVDVFVQETPPESVAVEAVSVDHGFGDNEMDSLDSAIDLMIDDEEIDDEMLAPKDPSEALPPPPLPALTSRGGPPPPDQIPQVPPRLDLQGIRRASFLASSTPKPAFSPAAPFSTLDASSVNSTRAPAGARLAQPGAGGSVVPPVAPRRKLDPLPNLPPSAASSSSSSSSAPSSSSLHSLPSSTSSGSLPAAPYNAVASPENMPFVEAQSILKEGQVFLKFGRRGKPQSRYVFLDTNNERICWREVVKPIKVDYVQLKDVQSLAKGHTTAVFKKQRNPTDDPDVCLSIITNIKSGGLLHGTSDDRRTLDLAADSASIRDRWFQALSTYLFHSRSTFFSHS
eukprot:TRINITY_DN2466_c0_g2_i1.p1 TRINITY_DN2466_c0_g2~~TRINITY_DN2466_c0_g2_i1.p1  ORF type:complete len:694 (-),score=250.52 TRINITY_DN2466_c0_g2_i1:193-2148(-)